MSCGSVYINTRLSLRLCSFNIKIPKTIDDNRMALPPLALYKKISLSVHGLLRRSWTSKSVLQHMQVASPKAHLTRIHVRWRLRVAHSRFLVISTMNRLRVSVLSQKSTTAMQCHGCPLSILRKPLLSPTNSRLMNMSPPRSSLRN